MCPFFSRSIAELLQAEEAKDVIETPDRTLSREHSCQSLELAVVSYRVLPGHLMPICVEHQNKLSEQCEDLRTNSTALVLEL